MAENTPQRHLARMDNTEVADAEDDGYDVNARENIDSPQKGRARISQVSRPPSSHITRVDEEPTGSDGRRSGAPLVETVDRGVGPTPRPPPPPPGAALEPTLSSYFSFQPFPAARNDLLEAYGIPYVYSHLPHSVNTPLPINPSTLEGRYHWPPTSPFHRHFHGMPPSPIPADISLLNMRCPTLPVDNPVTQLASRLRFDQLQRSYYSPLSSRRFSPASLPGLPFGTGPFLVDYPPPPSISGRSLFSDFQPTPGSGSITLPGSLESSRLTSPRASIVGGKSRKRALSHSPLSDFLDIQSLTRSSEGSLQLASFLQHSSRSSSAASGSYGHLSVASVGAPSPSHAGAPPHPYLQAGCWGPPTLFYPLLGGHPPPVGHMVPPSIHVPKTLPKSDPQAQISTTTKESGSSSVVSSSRAASRELHKAKFKRDTGNLNIVTVEPDDEDEDFAERRCSAPQEETDIAETNCHWVDCSRDFQSQDDLVTHINQDHIQSNKKSFVCRWRECSREEKPFKAQYMLVVHMRRHTGEKPHRCTFEGCNKAYSRLENLKTHLRSHTGEKPYMCEFPGCTKAFSNASDRAKHQNRTHSNAKPYVCKAVGCSKRYTDPSSLRKHVKTVHGADFYANKKHKGDASCHLKKEGSNGDHKFCETSRQGEGHIQSSRPLFQVSGNGRQSQDNIGSAPSSHSHPSPESSPEVNVICDCEPGQSYLTDDHNVYSGGLIRTTGVEDQDVLMAESSDAEISGSGVLLSRRSRLNVGHVMQNRLKCQINSKVGSIPSLPHTATGTSNNVGDRLIQLSVTKLLQGSPVKGSTEHDSISYSAREKSHIHNGDACRTLLPTSRRESSSSTLSSYMSSMRSMGSTFSSRRSSGTSPFSSRRSSGTSARLSIANSPYEYDINGNLPNCVSRRSSGESSTNVSRMMQKTHIGNQHCLPTPPVAGVVKSGGGVCNGMDNKAGNKCYNERLARYFSSWPTIDGSPTKQNLNEMFTSTPRQTPLPRGFPDQEIRRASDPVRFHDSSAASQKHLHRFHSLSVMQPLPIPDSMQSLRDKKGRTTDIVDNNNEASVNTFSSSRTHVDMYDNLVGSDSNSNVIKDDIDRNIFQDGEDLITLDDMRVFLNECLGGGMSLQEYVGEISPNDLPVQQKLELNIDACDLEPVDSVSLLLSPCLENGDVVGDYNVENVENGDSVEGNLLLYTDLPDFCQSLLANRSSVEEDFRQLSPTFENLALVDGIKIEPELLLNDCQEGRYDAYPVEADELARSDGSLQQINGSVQNHVQLYLNGHGDYNNASLPEQGGLVSSSTARKSEEYQSMSYKSKEVSRQKARVGRNVSGHDSMPEYGRSSNDLASITVQESHKPRSRNSLTCLASQEARSGFGACSPQHSSQHHQLQQQPHTVSTLSALPSYPYLNNHHHHDNDHKMLPSPSNVGNFLPTPPVGSKPSILRQKRFSPQLQVPHISQSQIPANDKATSQAQLLLKQQQDQQHRGQQNPDTHADPSLSSHVPQLQETFSATKYHNQKLLSRDLHQLYSQNLQKLSPSEPSHRNTGSGAHTNHLRNGGHYNDTMHIPTSDQARSRNYSMSQSITPATVHPVNPLRNDNLNTETRDIYHTNQIPCRSASKAQNAIMSSVNLTNHFTNDSQHNMTNNISTSGQSSSKSPNTTLASADPQNINNIHASLFRNIHPQASSLSNHPPDVPSNSSNTCNPTEMSPGCHQVTSSTDCKDTTAMLIDDFMDTFSSISLENMIENIPYSPAPMSVRSASRNSGHYSALMSTSNMVVNDMCSVLTQLAEENKYLSMRP